MRPMLPFLVLVGLAAFAKPGREADFVAAARSQIGKTLSYDARYARIPYPGGDIPLVAGCCTDVVIRAYRSLGLDLQKLVHEDILLAPGSYRGLLTHGKPDTNIDHRRVSVVWAYLRRHASVRPCSPNPADYRAGDLVIWRLQSGRLHLGVVSFAQSGEAPLVIHNIIFGPKEEAMLFGWPVIGHYRYALD